MGKMVRFIMESTEQLKTLPNFLQFVEEARATIPMERSQKLFGDYIGRFTTNN